MPIPIYIFEDGRRCAQNPTGPDFTVCGDASDSGATERGEKRGAVEGNGTVNCPRCIKVIEGIKALRNWKTRGALFDFENESPEI